MPFNQLKKLAKALLERYAREDASEPEEDGEGSADESDESEEEEEGDLAAYRVRGPGVRRAHKEEAMAHLRAWLTERSAALSAPELSAVQERFQERSIVGVNTWQLIEDVMAHQSRERIWQAYGVWWGRSATGAQVCSAVRPDAPPWMARAAAAPAAAEEEDATAALESAPPAAVFDASQAELTRLLAPIGLAYVMPHLHRVLGVWRVEQLPSLREADLLRVHAAMPRRPGLPDEQRRVLLEACRDALEHAACALCSKVASLAVSLPCGCATACAGCTRAFRADAANGAVCVACRAPATVVEPPEVRCPVCLDDFTPAEVFTLSCGHQLCVGASTPFPFASVMQPKLPFHFIADSCAPARRPRRSDIACMVGFIRRAVDDRLNLLPLKCETCRAQACGASATPDAAQALQPLSAAALRPLVRLSRTLVYNPSCPPLRREELSAFEEHHAEAQGLLARCPAAACAATVPLAPGAEARVECGACAQPFCCVCCVAWHEGLSCAEHVSAQAAPDDATAGFMRDHIGRCPTAGCAQPSIHERGHACHHVTCKGCTTQYCVVCSSPWAHGCTATPPCRLFCDDNCNCPDCVVCRPNAPCTWCDNDGRCRTCQPGLGGQPRGGFF
jgi:hypothetical protein